FISDSLSPKKTQRLEISLPLEGLAPLEPTHTTASVNRNRHCNGPPGPSKESPATFAGHNVFPLSPSRSDNPKPPISAGSHEPLSPPSNWSSHCDVSPFRPRRRRRTLP
ncbi:hypothetical protein V8G54_026830, partial [Vigna mungo]